MAHAYKDQHAGRAWLDVADEVLRTAPKPDVYLHAPRPDASIESLRVLAGAIRLKGPVPAWDLFEDHGDEAVADFASFDAIYRRVDDLHLWNDLIHGSSRT
jgi:hypothetical protein